jgi:hypothetical protein
MAYQNKALRQFMSQLRLVGGVEAITLSDARTLHAKDANILFLDPGGSSRNITLLAEDEAEGLFFIIVNEADNPENLVILDDGGSTIVTINQSEWAIVACDGTTWRDIPLSALADYLATANAWTAAQTFQNMIFGAASELTIASGAVAATRSYHTIDTEADAASDDLDDITGLAAGEILFVTPADAGRSVVLRHAIGANKIATLGARNITLAETTDWVLLVGNGTQAVVLAASTLADGFLASANTFTARQTLTGGLTSLDHIFAAATELTIATGAVTATQGVHTLDTEADAASDDLDTIAGGTAEEVILVRPASAARTVVLKHAIGANRIACPNGRDLSLAEATDWALLAYNGTQWSVIGHSVLGESMWAGCPSSGDGAVLSHVFFEDFIGAVFSASQWVLTADSTGTAVIGDAQHGVCTITCAAASDNDGNQIIYAQETFRVTSGKKMWFEARVRCPAGDASNLDFFLGLAETEDLTGVADNMPANGIGFHKEDGAPAIALSSSDNGTNTEQAAVGTLADNTWIKLGFYFNGGASGVGTITPYVDGVAGTPIVCTYGTMAEMAPIFMIRNGDGIVTQVLNVDYVKVVAER